MKTVLFLLLSLNLCIGCCYAQDSAYIRKNEWGRYMNVSNTNLEIRAIELSENHVTVESLNIPQRTFAILDRDKSVIMVLHKGAILFLELKRNRIVLYQRFEVEENSIESYRKGKRTVRNVFKKVDYGIKR